MVGGGGVRGRGGGGRDIEGKWVKEGRVVKT